MGIATVHYLSMNVLDGKVSGTSPGTQGIQYTYNLTNLQPSTAYTIVWGDSTSNTSVTTNSSGAGSATHTYVDAGSYTVTVKLGTRNVAKTEIVVGYDDGTIAADGTVTEGVEETFTLASLAPSYGYTINWGDGEPTSSVTTNSSGAATATHTFAEAGSYTVQVLVGSHVSASVSVTVVAP